MLHAVIDLGTHTVLLLIADVQGQKVTLRREEERIVGLGRDAGAGNRINEEAIRRTVQALTAYKAIIAEEGAGRVRCTATAVLRNASNAQPVKALLENTIGHPFQIISGLEEARLVYLAASRTFPDLKDKTVVDIGGGSTEIIEGTGDKAGKLISLPLGAILLTERFIRHFPTPQAELSGLQAYILEKQQEALKDFDRTGHRHVVGVAGTFTTAGAMEMKLTDYDPDKITGFAFKKAWAQAWLDRLGKLSIDQQKQIPGLHPERAGFVVAGMALILSLYDFFGIEEIILCDAGLRYGVLYDWIRS